MARNEYKKVTFEDKFFRDFVCVKFNHPKIWAWMKKQNRKKYRRILKKDLTKQLNMI